MTIAVIWQTDGLQWCAADTRLVVGENDDTTSEIAAKIYSIPVVARSSDRREPPHYSHRFGFVYAGAVLPATMTAITASTFLQQLVGDPTARLTFEQLAEFVYRLAKRFMMERQRFGGDGTFSAAFFGWCPQAKGYKLAHIDGRQDSDVIKVELTYPSCPVTEGTPWLTLGAAAQKFESTFAACRSAEESTMLLPYRVIERMVSEKQDKTVGGSTSLSMANVLGFELFWMTEPVTSDQAPPRRIFNGLDIDAEVGPVGQHIVGTFGFIRK